eukprot:COSAG01_NODE_24221_length_786_cov_1.082969_1_plen_77_part_00
MRAKESVPAEEDQLSHELEWEAPTLGGPYPWTTDHAQEQAALLHKENPDFAAAVEAALAQKSCMVFTVHGTGTWYD